MLLSMQFSHNRNITNKKEAYRALRNCSVSLRGGGEGVPASSPNGKGGLSPYPHPVLIGWGTPIQSRWRRSSPIQSQLGMGLSTFEKDGGSPSWEGWGYPLQEEWGYLHQEGWGYPPVGKDGMGSGPVGGTPIGRWGYPPKV